MHVDEYVRMKLSFACASPCGLLTGAQTHTSEFVRVWVLSSSWTGGWFLEPSVCHTAFVLTEKSSAIFRMKWKQRLCVLTEQITFSLSTNTSCTATRLPNSCRTNAEKEPGERQKYDNTQSSKIGPTSSSAQDLQPTFRMPFDVPVHVCSTQTRLDGAREEHSRPELPTR